MGMKGYGHEAIQHQLWSTADAMMVSYWDSFRQQVPDVNSPALLAPALQVRAAALLHLIPSPACYAPLLLPGWFSFSSCKGVPYAHACLQMIKFSPGLFGNIGRVAAQSTHVHHALPRDKG